MKTEKNILIAFVLNLAFSIFEFFGGVITGSVAIISDAVHDLGDAASIGAAFFLEKKSKRQPDEVYTYGYGRYSVIGSIITTLILLVGSVLVIANAINRIFNPVEIHYDGMILFAVVGICINFAAAFITREGDSMNQKAVNLHMIEDVLGWIVVLVGAVVMRFTDFALIDPIMSIAVAGYIFINAIRHLSSSLSPLLERTPADVDVGEISAHVKEIPGVLDVHHIHIWSMDGQNHYATMHIVTNEDPHQIKEAVRAELKEHSIGHSTLELEAEGEPCHQAHCHITQDTHGGGCCHHHHHH